MKNGGHVKVAIRRGPSVIVGTLTPPVRSERYGYGRWTGVAADGVTATADTAEECADLLADQR